MLLIVSLGRISLRHRAFQRFSGLMLHHLALVAGVILGESVVLDYGLQNPVKDEEIGSDHGEGSNT